jgi:hypothetical protein
MLSAGHVVSALISVRMRRTAAAGLISIDALFRSITLR